MSLTVPKELLEAGFWQRERRRCAKDFEYLASTYLRIKSKHVIGFPTLKFNHVQRLLDEGIRRQLQEEGWVRQIWEKPRQIGLTTYGEAFSFHNTAFKPYRNALMVAHDDPTCSRIMDMAHTFYDALPPALKPRLRGEQKAKAKLLFAGRQSQMIGEHARNLNVGAGTTNHIVHLTDMARYGDRTDEVWSAVNPSISEAKGEDYSSVIIEFTALYGGEWVKQFFEASRRGETGYRATFIPWFWHELYATRPLDGFRPDAEERELRRQVLVTYAFSLTDAYLWWRREKRKEYLVSPQLFEQDYPTTHESAWITPRGTFRVFKEEVIEGLRRDVRPPIFRATPTSTGLVRELGGPVEVWEAPQDGIFYDFGLDVSEGATEQADWTVGNVVRRDTLAQVAQFRLHIDPASEDLVDLCYWLGMAYHGAQFNPDITGGWGHAVLREMMRRNYPNIWRWRHFDDAKERASNKLGFLFTERSKRTFVTTIVGLVTRRAAPIRSETLLDEMRTYLEIGIGQWAAASGCYDDALTAWGLALLSARGEGISFEMPEEPEKQKTDPWLVHDIDADLRGPEPTLIDTSPWRV